MNIIYQGTDITNLVTTRKAQMRDTCGGRCDSLEIEFDNAAKWFRWGPVEDDKIIVRQGNYETGIMYVNTILPENGHFRIVATSLPCAARRKGYASFAGRTIEEIMRACAMECGMDYGVYGIDGKTVIPYFEREMESAPSMLYKLLKLEGAALKCVNGRYAGIGILYAQEREAKQTLQLDADRRGIEYRRSGQKLKRLTVRTPYAEATAVDDDVPETHAQEVFDLPARDAVQAGRWARGLLLCINRKCESLTIQTDFNAGMSAMARVNVTGGTDMDGAWLVEDALHDLQEERTAVTLRRCLTGIR